jgi:ABC-type sugar transport system ATPase subunit
VLQQVATPKELYALPAKLFVAGFLGNPPMNLLPATTTPGVDGAVVLQVAGGELPLRPARSVALPSSVIVGIRPEGLALAADGVLTATTTIAEMLGAEVHVIAALADGTRLIVRQDARLPVPDRDEVVHVSVTDPESMLVFDAESGQRLELA